MIEFQRTSGCRIPVVRLLWEQVDWVQFPAARPRTIRFAQVHGAAINMAKRMVREPCTGVRRLVQGQEKGQEKFDKYIGLYYNVLTKVSLPVFIHKMANHNYHFIL